ncbi:MAG: cytochrome b/b6 domain-containing protein [Candidatus Thiodiazotropha sp. (ex Semelilucina semeliformis)]|nr:cytochrome b/b6 domain-containing protein [Candidatus Thiodiazotropha sp. (ex Myrtea spinifera)]MCU7807104.1 cytochrome b/b6 domain-containing protein [Candidatus Thiodiazotropha sp. (ex Semelilucina semeliformis)]MCU7830892.1 cytochrome b/b6 domain-containing protein [Candidatus Thiodiazotropha sp. (ex Myrtea sp. 'scaly one' KF741663)]
MTRAIFFTRFERFWHWSQSLLIILMLITGFEIHGTYELLGFETAINVHTIAAWVLIGLWLLALFWHTTTGEWRQYVPADADSMLAMVRYYSVGIFFGAAHPFHRRRAEKHNPLQRMAYLMLTMIISPVIWLSGLLYLFYQKWSVIGLQGLPLELVALTHTLAAFAMLAFLVAHVYLAISTSEKPFGHLKEMLWGYGDE